MFIIIISDHSGATPAMTTVHPLVTLTTILIPPLQPEYEKLPVVNPASEIMENTTVKVSTTSAPTSTSHSQTIVNTKRPSEPTPTKTDTTITAIPTESSEKSTTESKTGERDFMRFYLFIWNAAVAATHTLIIYSHSWNENFEKFAENSSEDSTTVASANSSSTTFEVTYDVENSTSENITLEFVDLSTTEAISSTQSALQYLETASYKQGIFFESILFQILFCGSNNCKV